MCTHEKMRFGKDQVYRYDLEKDDAPREWLFMSIKPIWLLYEPWAEDSSIQQTIAKKAGRKIDVAIDEDGRICGFTIFRLLRHESLKIMFRGNSYFCRNVRGLGAALFRRTINQYKADRIVTFTQQERIYAFLGHFGKTLPTDGEYLSDSEYRLMCKLAGSSYTVDRETLIVQDFYHAAQAQEGGPVKNTRVRDLFTQLGERDAFAVVTRRN